MMIIGVDYHPSFQQISFLDQETGECGDRRLNHSDGEAERFYQGAKAERSQRARGDWRPPGIHAGSSGYWQSWVSRCGLGMPAEIKRQARPQAENRPRGRPTPVAVASGESLSDASGYRIQRIVICDNCFGTGIGWCRCARGS